MTPTFTVITCHAGDPFWVEQLTARIDRSAARDRIAEIVVVDQDRSPVGAATLQRLPGVGRVVEFAEHAGQTCRLGHDHPNALNLAVRLECATSHLIVMDSDALPIRTDWLTRVLSRLDRHACLVARDPSTFGLSHPAFMVLPSGARDLVDFAEGIEEVGLDTGRLVGLQLARHGLDVDFLGPKPGFSGRRGHLYLDGTIYHHGHGSFPSSRHLPHREATEADLERFYRAKIEADDFELDRAQRLRFVLQRLARAVLPTARDLSGRSRGLGARPAG